MKRIEPTILKGTRDFPPLDMAERNLVMDKITEIFQRFGYDQIETPVICPAETILGKYGDEGERLTYNFETKGGTKIALPFDLTVPFARFFAANYRDLPLPFKRYQIQRVWRAEKPQKGRLREFYQCDIDVIGTKSLMAESEIVKMIYEVFKTLSFENFIIKINSRRLMNSILSSFDIPEEKRMDTIRIIDKLNKLDKAEIIKELEALSVKDPDELIKLLKPEDDNDKTLGKLAKYDLCEIKEVLKYCDSLGVPEKYLLFDPSLARGLDYYTGITYEVTDRNTPGIGSVCGGGRYDNLCGLFCDEDFSGVGVAFGFERIMIILKNRGYFKDIGLNSQVLVTLFEDTASEDALKIYSDLTANGINTEIYFEAGKLGKQFKYADKKKIPFVVIQGPEEKARNEVSVKSMVSGKQKNIPLKQLISYLKGYSNGQNSDTK